LNGRDHLEDPTVDGRTILNSILKEWGVMTWNGFILLRTRGQLVASCKHDTVLSYSMKAIETLD
jgi:hypothetical protein